MEPKTIDRQKLTAYLLGTLPETEQEAIAEQYFTNDDLFEQLQEVEDDLIRQYVRGHLPAEARPRLETYLQVLPDARRKVALAHALAEIGPAERTAAEAVLFGEPTPIAAANKFAAQTTGLWQRFVAWLAQPMPALVMVIGLTLLGGALIWLLLRNLYLNHDKEQLFVQMQQRDARQEQSLREVERKLSDEQTRHALLQQELERERQRREAQSPVQFPAASLPILRWPLSYLAVRDPRQPSETVRLDPKAKTVALTIPVKGKQKYTGYEVELKTEDGTQILWKDNQPNAPPIRSAQGIVFYRPAREFIETSYKLTLTLISDKETKTRDYYFTVARR